MTHLKRKCSFVVLALTIAFSASYAQVAKQVIKSGTRALGTGAGEFSILRQMDAWDAVGKALKPSIPAEAVEQTVKKAVTVRKESPDHAFRNSGFFDAITPSEIKKLEISLIHPTNEQVQKAVNEYRKVVKNFESLHKEVSAKLLYKTLPNDKWTALFPQERRDLIKQVAQLQRQVEKLRRVVFSKDPALIKMEEWLDRAMQEINPFYVPGVHTRTRPDDRVFDRNEFFLKDLDWRVALSMPQIPREVPENFHVAVLNDQQEILAMYRAWAQQGRLGKGWTVATYKDTNELLQSLKDGHMYDLIITDLTVPGGGGYYLVDQVRNMHLNIPVIGCSAYTIDKLNAEKMFEQGFDGYIYADDMFDEMAGSVAWMGYIKNYYYYKNLHGWGR